MPVSGVCTPTVAPTPVPGPSAAVNGVIGGAIMAGICAIIVLLVWWFKAPAAAAGKSTELQMSKV